MSHGGSNEIGIDVPSSRKEGVTQLTETALLRRAISATRLRAPSHNTRVRSVNAAHRALTSRSGGSSPSGRTGASMVDSGALNAVKRVRFPQPHGSTIFDNQTARDGRLRRRRSLRTCTTRGTSSAARVPRGARERAPRARGPRTLRGASNGKTPGC